MRDSSKFGRRLAEGVAGWLLYEFHCGRGDLFSEKYITHPVGSILAAEYGGRVQAEYNHPILASASAGGRKPQIDFAVLKNPPVGSDRKAWLDRSPTLAVESKWLSRTPLNVADIVWDILRLEILVSECGVEAYLVLAGLEKMIKELFQSDDFKMLGTNRTIVPTTSKGYPWTLDIWCTNRTVQAAVDKKKIKYPGVLFPETASVERPHVYPPVDSKVNLTFSVYVWKIGRRCKNERLRLEARDRSKAGAVKRDNAQLSEV